MRQGIIVFLPLYAADAHQDFHMRIDAHGSAYAHHPHEPHGSATAWPGLAPFTFTFTFTLESEEFEKFEKVGCCCVDLY